MMSSLSSRLRRAEPLAEILMIALTAFWTYWGAFEMYHEGWWGAWTNRLPYLAPIALTLGPTLLAFRWPRLGGALIAAVGLLAIGMFHNAVAVIGLAVVLVGLVFLAAGQARAGEPAPSLPAAGWRRRGRYGLAIGLPAAIFLVASAMRLPTVLSRLDDGDRGARRIDGNGLTLVWAPEGPGWNWRQDWGGYPSWQDLALYGLPPVGLVDKPGYDPPAGSDAPKRYASDDDMARYPLCRYLDAAGLQLMDAPQDVWRMPSVDELARSLVRQGRNAGCRWQGELREPMDCRVEPDKESPLWATDQPAIYYWAAESYVRRDDFGEVIDTQRAYYVSFNGVVNVASKRGGNPRNGYRCVREP